MPVPAQPTPPSHGSPGPTNYFTDVIDLTSLASASPEPTLSHHSPGYSQTSPTFPELPSGPKCECPACALYMADYAIADTFMLLLYCLSTD